MSRLAPLTPETMTDQQRDLVKWYDETIGGGMMITHLTWLRSPEFTPHIYHFAAYLRRKSMDFRKRELAILTIGRACQAPFEWYEHLPAAREAGIEEYIIDALREARVPDFQREDDRLVYQVCAELLNTLRVSQETYDRAMELFGPKIMVELVGITGLYSMLAMLIGTFDFQLPPGSEPGFKATPVSRNMLPLP